MEEIKIKTIEDIVDKVPFEDIDLFFDDLRSRLSYHNKIKGLGKFIRMHKKEFIWINDGKTDEHISVRLEKD